MNRKDERSKNGKGQILTASIAVSECHQGETESGGSAPMPTNKPTTGAKSNGQKHNRGGGVAVNVPFTNSERNTERFYIPSGYLRTCDICGNEYTAKRDTSKFCSGRCRQQAWLKNHPEIASAKNAAYRDSLKARIEARGGRWVER